MTTLFLDPAGGIGGDMFLAGLCGLGLDVRPLETLFQDNGLDVTIRPEPRTFGGLAGTGIVISHAGNQPLRTLPDIRKIITGLGVSKAVRDKSLAAFQRLGEVEAGVHGVDINTIHFHEVGAMDTIVDVLGAFWGVEQLGIEEVCSAPPLPWFRGSVTCAHGTLPLPAPAAAELLKGKPVYESGATDECITPTGALIIDQIVDRFVDGPTGTVTASATSYGDRYEPGRINGLRMFLYKKAHRHTHSHEHEHDHGHHHH